MKKLISAASALAMAASMVGAAVPFATGAADSSKGIELRPYLNKDGSAASTTISAEDIAAGDVTIPVGVFLVEDTNDSQGITANWTITSKDGDASNVKFAGYVPNEDYFTEAQTVTAGGKEYKVSKFVNFSGTISASKVGTLFAPSGTGMYNVADKYDSLNLKNSWGSVVWTKPAKTNYEWTGEKSDSFPMYVFEVTFPKGTKAGTYSINFLDDAPDAKYPTQFSTMIEGTTKFATEYNNLNLKGIDIKIGGDASTPETTTAPTPAVTTTATSTIIQTVTTTKAPNNDSNLEVNANFVIKGKEYTIEPGHALSEQKDENDFDMAGEFIVESSGGAKCATFVAELADVPAGFTVDMVDTFCYAIEGTPSYNKVSSINWNASVFDKNSDPQSVMDGNPICQFEIVVDKSVKPGKYEINLKRFQVIENAGEVGSTKVEYLATVTPIIVNVPGETKPAETTTAPVVTTTKAPATTTAPVVTTTAQAPATTTAPVVTTTQAPVGDRLPGDANVNGVVDIADVVVVNRFLANTMELSEQGKANADCCDTKLGADINAKDSDAIIKSIVHLVTLDCTSDQL